MNYGIQRLCHLVQVKNDLNRKRRRFYEIAHPRSTRLPGRGPRYEYKDGQIHFAYSKMEAIKGYEQTKLQMKAMTAEMRTLRKDIGAELRWTDGGAISHIFYQGDHIKAGSDFFNQMIELYHADGILLGA